MAESREAVLTVQGLCTSFYSDAGVNRVLEGIDFTLHQGEVLGIGGSPAAARA
jgi:ABC-type glutathione transport system ATPase component